MQKGWIYEYVIPEYESLLFYNALRRLQDGYCYHPVAYAKREEYGFRYRFLCIAKKETNPDISSHFADIEIYKPMNGMPYVSNLFRVEFDQMFPYRYPYR